MNHKLTPTILKLGGQVLEGYERQSRATEEALKSQIGIAPVEEFLVLQASNILANDTVSWSLDRIGQDVKIESLFIDSPNIDSLTFELFNGNNKVFTIELNRNGTPYDFPDYPLPSNLKIQIKANSQINLLTIVLKPVVILETFLPDQPTIPIRISR